MRAYLLSTAAIPLLSPADHARGGKGVRGNAPKAPDIDKDVARQAEVRKDDAIASAEASLEEINGTADDADAQANGPVDEADAQAQASGEDATGELEVPADPAEAKKAEAMYQRVRERNDPNITGYRRSKATEAEIRAELGAAGRELTKAAQGMETNGFARAVIALADFVDLKVNPSGKSHRSVVSVVETEAGVRAAPIVPVDELKKQAIELFGYTRQYKRAFGRLPQLDAMLPDIVRGAYLLQAQWKGATVLHFRLNSEVPLEADLQTNKPTSGTYRAMAMPWAEFEPNIEAKGTRGNVPNKNYGPRRVPRWAIQAQFANMFGKPLDERGRVKRENPNGGQGTEGNANLTALAKEVKDWPSEIVDTALFGVAEKLRDPNYRIHVRQNKTAMKSLTKLYQVLMDLIDPDKEELKPAKQIDAEAFGEEKTQAGEKDAKGRDIGRKAA